MNPVAFIIAGAVLFALALAVQIDCLNHRSFGTMVDDVPHWSTMVAGAMWVPITLAVVLMAAGLVLVYVQVAP